MIQIITGVLFIISSLIIGSAGAVASITGLVLLPTWTQVLAWFLGITALIFLKQVLVSSFKYVRSTRYITVFIFSLVLQMILFLIARQSSDFTTIVGASYLVDQIVLVVALAFYISLLKVKNTWLQVFAWVGVVVSGIEILVFALTWLYVSDRSYMQYENQYFFMRLILTTITFILKEFRDIILGGFLVYSGLELVRKRKTR